jgi:hypothetical protein
MTIGAGIGLPGGKRTDSILHRMRKIDRLMEAPNFMLGVITPGINPGAFILVPAMSGYGFPQ